MGSVYQRQDSPYWWIAFVGVDGVRRPMSSRTKDEKVARNLLSIMERKIAAEIEAGATVDEGMTVSRFAKRWIDGRRKRGIASTDDDEARLDHALKSIGHLKMSEVRPLHIRTMVRGLMDKAVLAPRTIRHVYGVVRVMFNDAVDSELLVGTPCVLRERRGDLPKKVDKDAAWRGTAVFTRGEVEMLISDTRIAEAHRVVYAMMFLGGLRISEVSARRWRDIDVEAEPLDRMTVASAFVFKRRAEKASTKSGVTRYVPVHPTLSAMLARWNLSGWKAWTKRQPQPDDLIVPGPFDRGFLSSTLSLQWFHDDLKTLGLRIRRQHDARRTFVTLSIADGARKDILRWVSHGPEGDIVDLYTSLPWQSLCEEVQKLRITTLKTSVAPVARTTGATY